MTVTMFHYMPSSDFHTDFPRGLASARVDARCWERGDVNQIADDHH